MTQKELNDVLVKHQMWLDRVDGGERINLKHANLECANLKGVNLEGASLIYSNLSCVNLRCANLEGANLEGAQLEYANLGGAQLEYANLKDTNLKGANLEGANLKGANLKGANLKDVDLDHSCIPLQCGSLHANFDDRQLKQIAYHLVKAGLQSNNASEETKQELAKIVDFANGFHLVEECGKIILEEKT